MSIESDGYARLRFPQWRRAVFHNFSLYSLAPEIDLVFAPGVYCLAGANGLGKSTFIAALNFALTGTVPDPTRKFDSADEYYRYTADFSRRYFAGRVAEADRDRALVELEVSVGDTVYHLARRPFEPRTLEDLWIDGRRDEFEALSPGERHEAYAQRLAHDIGLDSFEQFVFLQLFLLTFDERRLLLFWDQRVMEQLLFLAFGVDNEVAQEAETLRRRADRFDSNGRNAQYRATQIRQRLKQLERSINEAREADDSDAEALGEWERLESDIAEWSEARSRAQSTLEDARLRVAGYASELSSLEEDLQATFREVAVRVSPRQHPVVSATLETERCAVCGTLGPAVSEEVERVLGEEACPLCRSSLGSRVQHLSPDVATIAQRIRATRDAHDESASSVARLSEEIATLDTRLSEANARRAQLQSENLGLMLGVVPGPGDVPYLEALRIAGRDATAKRDEAYAKRDEARALLAGLQSALFRRYQTVETQFVPAFQNLAKAFLGLDLTVRLESRPTTAQLQLLLDVEGAPRRELYQLSESQRFFVDIALRMALAQFISPEGSPAGLLVDTPEGSLDIAYESRAGDMIASFAQSGHSVIMTANINTSKLLIRLAEKCGPELMQLERMTGWAPLSDVQIAEEGLFDQAFDEIVAALGS